MRFFGTFFQAALRLRSTLRNTLNRDGSATALGPVHPQMPSWLFSTTRCSDAQGRYHRQCPDSDLQEIAGHRLMVDRYSALQVIVSIRPCLQRPRLLKQRPCSSRKRTIWAPDLKHDPHCGVVAFGDSEARPRPPSHSSTIGPRSPYHHHISVAL